MFSLFPSVRWSSVCPASSEASQAKSPRTRRAHYYHQRRPTAWTSPFKMTLLTIWLLLATLSMSEAFRVYRDSDELDDNDTSASTRAELQLELLRRLLTNPEISDSLSSLNRKKDVKRGPAGCVNNCLTGGMSFVRCKSMCH